MIFGLKEIASRRVEPEYEYCLASCVKQGCCHLCFWMKSVIIDVIKATSLLDGFLFFFYISLSDITLLIIVLFDFS
jgi:hypothetical protein